MRAVAMYVLVLLSKNVTSQQRLALLKVLEQYDCELLTESTIAINTRTPAEQLLESVQDAAGVRDGVYLIPVPDSYSGPAPAKVREWLENSRGDFVGDQE